MGLAGDGSLRARGEASGDRHGALHKQATDLPLFSSDHNHLVSITHKPCPLRLSLARLGRSSSSTFLSLLGWVPSVDILSGTFDFSVPHLACF